jgi:alpha-tubulin suppressor-like RCC1 family protein
MISAGGESGTGNGNSLAVKIDGSLWAVGGWNTTGSLGLGDRTNRSSPVQIGSAMDWKRVCVATGVVAVKTTGALWAWGTNGSGQLGQGDISARSSPVQIGSLLTWSRAIVTRGGSVFAIKTDGTLWAWGYNGGARLGLGDTTNRSSPCQVGSASDWAYIASSPVGHTLAVTTGGKLYAWGFNTNGQLGLGDTTFRSSPIQIGSDTNWKYVNAIGEDGASLALKTNGTLWSWGRNNGGQLAQGDVVSRSSPVQIGSSTNWSSLGQPFTSVNSQFFAIQTP